MRDAETVLNVIMLLESRMTRKCHVRFGGGPMEKEPKSYLASGLPYIVHGLREAKTSVFGLRARLALASHQRHIYCEAIDAPVGHEDGGPEDEDVGVVLTQARF